MNSLTLPEILWSCKFHEFQTALEQEMNKAAVSVQDLEVYKEREEKIINQWATLLDFFWQSFDATKQQLVIHPSDSKEYIEMDIYYSRLQNSINFYSMAMEIRKTILKQCEILLRTVPVLRVTYEKRIQSKNVVKHGENFLVEYLEERKIQVLKTGDRIVSEWRYMYDLQTCKL